MLGKSSRAEKLSTVSGAKVKPGSLPRAAAKAAPCTTPGHHASLICHRFGEGLGLRRETVWIPEHFYSSFKNIILFSKTCLLTKGQDLGLISPGWGLTEKDNRNSIERLVWGKNEGETASVWGRLKARPQPRETISSGL